MSSTSPVYSGYVTSSGKQFMRARINFTISSSATTTTFTFDAGVQINSGYTTNAKITVACLGQSKTVDDKGWSGGYHQMISGSTSWARTTSKQTKSVTCTITLGNGSTATGTVSVDVPALESYAVTYDANGGSGAPSAQAKYYNVSLTLSSTTPTKAGHTFLKWNTNSSGTGTDYAPGGVIPAGANAALTLYAIWQADTYTVSYDANEGTGTVPSQTKTYGVDLTLQSGSQFSRALYSLDHWNTASNDSGTSYPLSGTYTGNSALTLYAIWKLDYIKPIISNFVCYRSDANGVADDTGQYISISLDYTGGTTDRSSYITPRINVAIDGTPVYDALQSGGTGTFSQTFGSAYSENVAHSVIVQVYDDDHSSLGVSASATVSSATFPMDILADGSAMGVMTPAVRGQQLTLPIETYINGSRIGGGGVVGAVQMFAGASAPQGWKICDGSAVSRTVYSALFAVIGITYGSGDGSTTFNLPNLQGRIPVGVSASYALGDTGGSEDAIIPYHNHSVSAVSGAITGGSHSHQQRGWYGVTANSGTVKECRARNTISSDAADASTNIASTHTHDLPAHNTNYAGTSGNAVGANMQPYLVMNYIIYAGA